MLSVAERGHVLSFSIEDLMRFHGPGSPGGVAHAYKVLERALPLLSVDGPAERREITIRTAFGGPGARDGIECVTRAASDGRYVVDPSLARPGLGRAMERFVFELGYRGRVVTLVVRAGLVTDAFIDLARKEGRSHEEERRLDAMKRDMAERVMSRSAAEAYDVET